MNPYIGMIMLWSGPQIPLGWLACNGLYLTMEDEYVALYSIIGNTYGGVAGVNFRLPDLQSRVPVGTGQGSGLGYYFLGQNGGSEYVILTQSQLAQHNHAVLSTPNLTGSVSLAAKGLLPASKSDGTSDTPGPNLFPAKAPDYASAGLAADKIYGATDGTSIPVTVTLSPNPASVTISGGVNVAVQNAGANEPHTNIQPFLALQYIIAYQGLYPSFA